MCTARARASDCIRTVTKRSSGVISPIVSLSLGGGRDFPGRRIDARRLDPLCFRRVDDPRRLSEVVDRIVPGCIGAAGDETIAPRDALTSAPTFRDPLRPLFVLDWRRHRAFSEIPDVFRYSLQFGKLRERHDQSVSPRLLRHRPPAYCDAANLEGIN
jgi:hypothetical protein